MSNIFALTEEARRRAEGMHGQGCTLREKEQCPIASDNNSKEILLLLIILAMLVKCGANMMILLAIMYVIL